ncbi:putative SGNH hydrolase-type esterase domain-containing protein [Gammaproteobacteria bacterium]
MPLIDTIRTGRRSGCLVILALVSLVGIHRAQGQVALEGEGDARWRGFINELQQLEGGTGVTPLRMLQLGDSHTAADYFTEVVRRGLQDHFGDAGIGWLMPAKVPNYRSSRVRIQQSRGWTTRDSSRLSGHGAVFGLGGFLNSPLTAGEWVQYEFKTDPPEVRTGDRIQVYYRTQGEPPWLLGEQGRVVPMGVIPDAGIASNTNGHWAVAEGRSSMGGFELRSRTGQMTLAGVTLETGQAGVVLDSIGIIGAQTNLLLHWDPEAVRRQLKNRDYRLILLEFGTNEAFDIHFTAEGYQADLRQAVEFLASALPRAALILIAPPDAEERAGACAKSGSARVVGANVCPSLSPNGCAWRVHPNLAPIRRIQRQIAREKNLLYWDWSAVMAGACGNHRWTQLNPPLARPDHVHLTERGYEASGQALLQAMMARYRAAGS